MAFTVTNSASMGTQPGDISTAFDCTGGNLLIFIGAVTSTTTTGTPTYNGVSMTQAVVNTSTSRRSWVYYIVNPATGSNTFAFDFNNAPNCAYAIIAVSGADASDTLEGSNTDNATDNQVSCAVTQAGSVGSFGVLMAIRDDANDANSWTDGSGQTTVLDGGLFDGSQGKANISYRIFSGTGSKAMTSDYSVSTAQNGVMALFNAANEDSGGTLTMMGV